MEYDGTNRYTCNSDGSLASVLAGDVALSYKYDALGRRVLKESSAADSVLYLYDQADRCIAEYTSPDDCATLACSAGYVYADADALGAPIAVEDSAGSYQYVATDPQGNVIYQTPSCSHIVLVKYDAYGNIYNTSAGDLNLPFRFAGMRYEKDTDIYLTPNRAYSPAIGRWLQPDPLGTLPNPKQGNRFSPLSQYTDGRNLYEYCAGDPINERDLLGLKCNCNLAEKMLCRWEEVDFKLRNRSYWSLGLPFGIGDNLALVYRHGVAIDKCVWREKVCKERIIWDSMRLEGVYRVWTEFWPPVFVFFSDSIELPIRKVAEEIGGLV